MNIHQLRNLAGREEIDYLFLTSALQSYSKPRQKISRWLKAGELIRVKKGILSISQGKPNTSTSRGQVAGRRGSVSEMSTAPKLYPHPKVASKSYPKAKYRCLPL